MPTNLKPEDHFIKHVSSGRLKRRDDGTVYGIFPQAFETRPTENELSGSWLEYFAGDHLARLRSSASAIAGLLKVKLRDGFAVANVGKIHDACSQFDGVRVRILHEPSKSNPNPAYATIRNLPRDNLELLARIAEAACTEVRVARDLL